MSLKLYRRHRQECEAGHPEDARTGQFEEGRRGWKKCRCMIHVSGTLAGKFSRKQTGKTDWEEAKALAAQWEKADRWDGQGTTDNPVSLPIAPPASDPARVTVARAIAAFTSEFEEYAAQATRKKYKRLLRRLQSFSDA